jgi:hypothetical protein
LGDGISEKYRVMPSQKNDTQAAAVLGQNKVHLTMPTDGREVGNTQIF